MNKLINIQNKDGKQLVSAKELYIGLGLNRAVWSRWYVTNIEKNEFFKENIDWVGVQHNVEGNETKDFAITLEFAKHIAMMARTEKSHEYRNYFIECEKRVKDQQKPTCIEDVLIQSLQEMKEVKQQLNQVNHKVLQTKEEVQAIREVVEIVPSNSWRGETNRLMTKICFKLNNYQKPKEEAYRALKERGNCRPNVLVNNLKKRAALNGMAPSKVEKLNILDVLENEPRLKEIYVAIVKEMAIKHGVRV